jgi:hypothetical protein
MKHPVFFLSALLGLAACDAEVESRKAATPGIEVPAPTALPVQPLAAAGPATTIQPDTTDDLQRAASVVDLDVLTRQTGGTVKLFGTAGGDPAMNGLYTYIAFYRSSADGWAVFRIGDVLNYRVRAETPGRVDLAVTESVLDEATGQIGERERRLIVAWTPGPDGAPPTTITVTPAQ